MSTLAIDTAAAPLTKFVGGKRQLLPEILPRIPAKIKTYYEPFCGGAAVFFALANEGRFKQGSAVLADTNAALINMLTEVRDRPASVITHLHSHDAKHSEEHYYLQRGGRQEGPAGAARFIYLLKTCFNGLWRENQDGGMNAPFGHHEPKPKIVNASAIRAASRSLQGVTIIREDFETVMERAGVGDFGFFDPPYLPASKTANFVAYGSAGFGITDHERLADCMAATVKRGARALLSNSDTPEARHIFGRRGWQVEEVKARRSINSNGAKRGAVGEILVSAPKLSRKVVK
jgi:DNA adenine methylase